MFTFRGMLRALFSILLDRSPRHSSRSPPQPTRHLRRGLNCVSGLSPGLHRRGLVANFRRDGLSATPAEFAASRPEVAIPGVRSHAGAAQGFRLCRRLDRHRAEPAARGLLRTPGGQRSVKVSPARAHSAAYSGVCDRHSLRGGDRRLWLLAFPPRTDRPSRVPQNAGHVNLKRSP